MMCFDGEEEGGIKGENVPDADIAVVVGPREITVNNADGIVDRGKHRPAAQVDQICVRRWDGI
jgi:hypothetical protein